MTTKTKFIGMLLLSATCLFAGTPEEDVENGFKAYGAQNYTKAKEFFGKACDLGSQDGCDNYAKLNK
jgi:hypothetical protein